MKLKLFSALAGLMLCLTGAAQISVTPLSNATTLAQYLAGQNISVYNATFAGSAVQSGYFTYTGNMLQTSSGVILSTGNVADAIGPNNSENTTTSLNQPGDAALTALAGYSTYDRAELRFEFQVQSDYVEFNYIFASEEYNEFVNTSFNDVFAFYISGPGIVGEKNLAVVPTTNVPVTINSINNGSFWQFYNDNEYGALTQHVEFDGYTTKMKAIATGLIPCSNYTLRLVIADGSDQAYDSWVLLEENSLVQGNVSAITTTPTVDNTALEGCIQASFTFQLDSVYTYDIPINYEILGTAINGVDYDQIDNNIVIAAGQTSATIIINSFADGLTEGQETIYLVYEPTACAQKDTIELFIDDSQPIDYTLTGIDLGCAGDSSGQIDAAITGGFQPYVLTVVDSLNNALTVLSNNLPVDNLSAGTYEVFVDDVYGCNGDAQVISGQYDAGATFLPDGNGNVYTTSIPITGFGSAVLTSPDQLQSLCLNMEHSALGEVEIKLIAPNGTQLILKERFNNADGGHTNMGEPCAKGPTDGGNPDTTAGVGYDYCFTNNPVFGTMVNEQSNYNYTYTDLLGEVLTDNYLPAGSYTPYQSFMNLVGVPLDGVWTIWVKDHNPQDNGWIFNWSISFNNLNSGNTVTLLEPDSNIISVVTTSPACGANTGALNISVSGPGAPYTFAWSNGATTEDISNLAAGVYTVTVSNANGCTTTKVFTVSNIAGAVITETIPNQQCVGQNNGAIDISVSEPVSAYAWSNGAVTQDISNLSPGTYSVVVTAATGCITTKTFQVLPAVPMVLSSGVINEVCGNMEGEINLEVSGGASPYLYAWSNGASTQDLTDLVQNTYTVTVTDANTCTATHSATVINLVGQCTVACDLAISNVSITQETCGNANGSISITAFSSNTPVLYSWSNGATTSSLTNLSAGTYTVTLTDAEDCSTSQSYTIVNNAGTLMITSPVVVNETCGNNNGSINISVTGGNGTLTYHWSNGAATQDLSGLQEGTYSVTVTDQSNCSVHASFDVLNETSGMALTFQYVMHETCNNNQGSIDINLTTGTYTYLWSNGAVTQDLTGLSEGNYSCTVTQTGTGCQLITPVFTVQNLAGTLAVNILDYDHEYCNQNNGEIQSSVTGGSAPYSLLWSNGATTANLYNLNEGTYTCVATDANGCSASSGPVIIVNSAGTLSVTYAMAEEFCNNQLGSINLNVSGGAAPISYSWSNGETTEDIDSLSSGTYVFTVTDANQCSSSSSVYVSENSGSLAILNDSIVHTSCATAQGAIYIEPSGGSGAYIYNWSNGAVTEDLINIPTGVYSVTVSDAAGCSYTASYAVHGSLVLDSYAVTNDACNFLQGAINVEVSGGSLITYNWSNGAVTEDLTGLGAGNYMLHVSSFEGCVFDTTFAVVSTPGCSVMCTDAQSTELTGTLYDSGGPTANYANSQNCSFLIHPDCADSIIVTFTSFITASANDYLRVYDGANTSGIFLGSYSGSTLPPALKAASGQMYLQFVSNNSTNAAGFVAHWNTVPFTTAPTAGFTVSDNTPAFNTPVSFAATDALATTWQCDFNGDGLTDATTQNAAYTYTAAGSYTATLIASNCIGADTASQLIVVQGAPDISISPDSVTQYTITSCDSSASHSFLISNSGTGDLVWSGTSGTLTLVPSSGIVAPGAQQWVTVTIPVSATAGDFYYYNVITSNDADEPQLTDTVLTHQTMNCVNLMCSVTSSTQVSGQLTDDGGPAGAYSNNMNCGFLIHPDCADAITLTFASFATQAGSDFVRVYNGTDATGTLLGSFSGTTIPAAVTANSGAMYVLFTSNASTTNTGFIANWTTDLFTTAPAGVFTVSDNTPALGVSVAFTNTEANATNWLWDVNGDGTTDYTTQNVNHVYNTPGSYTVSLIASNCLGGDTTYQVVVVQPGPEIELSTDTATEYTIPDCSAGITHTFAIYNNGSGDLVWSGTNGLYALVPSSGTIAAGSSQLVTVVIQPGASPGDVTYYNVITSNDTLNPVVNDTVVIHQTMDCLFMICTDASSTQASGIITDSGGPTGNYGNNQSCSFLINPYCSDMVTLTFNTFATMNASDFLKVYDGAGASGTLLGTYYGTTLPPVLTATSGSMYLVFTSNTSGTAAGFKATWATTMLSAPPSAAFTVSDNNPPMASDVIFTATDANATAWSWDMENDGIADYTTQTAIHQYAAPGTYVVTLIASNCIGADTMSQTIVVQSAPAIALKPLVPTEYTFATCDTSVTHNFYIFNNGTGDLSWSASNGTSLFVPASGTVLPGDSQLVSVVFNSEISIGDFTYYNIITSNDPVNPQVADTVIIHQLALCESICLSISSASESGIITDDGGVNNNYGSNLYCGFLIQPVCAASINLTFESFQLEDYYDSVYVFDGTDNNGTLLGGFTGFTLPPVLTAQSGSMYVLMISDNMIEYSGFIASWNSVPLDWSAVSSVITPATCVTCNDGAIDLITTGLNGLYYTWSTGDNTEDVSALLPGNYSVTVATQSGCDSTFDFTVTSPDGINDLNAEDNDVQVYPNPVESYVFVEWNFTEQENVMIELTDVFGRSLYVSEQPHTGKLQLNMDVYAKGVYFIRCKNSGGEIIRKIEIVD